MLIVYIDQDDFPAVEALNQQQNLQIININDKKAKALDPNEPLIIMAHTDDGRRTLGDQSPKALVAKLAKLYGDNKAQAQHIYLISCEAGLRVNNNPPIAANFLNACKQKGFNQAQVHAITNNNSQKASHMYVEVVTRRGAGVNANPVGSVIGYYYPVTKDGRRHFEIGNQIDALKAELYFHKGVHQEAYAHFVDAVITTIQEPEIQNTINEHRQDMGQVLNLLCRFLTLGLKGYRTDSRSTMDEMKSQMLRNKDADQTAGLISKDMEHAEKYNVQPIRSSL